MEATLCNSSNKSLDFKPLELIFRSLNCCNFFRRWFWLLFGTFRESHCGRVFIILANNSPSHHHSSSSTFRLHFVVLFGFPWLPIRRVSCVKKSPDVFNPLNFGRKKVHTQNAPTWASLRRPYTSPRSESIKCSTFCDDFTSDKSRLGSR